MDQENLKQFEDRALFDAVGYFDKLAKSRPDLSPEVVAQLATVAAIEFQTAVIRRVLEEKLEGIEDILTRQ